jgi:hypothetical protein
LFLLPFLLLLLNTVFLVLVLLLLSWRLLRLPLCVAWMLVPASDKAVIPSAIAIRSMVLLFMGTPPRPGNHKPWGSQCVSSEVPRAWFYACRD